MTDRPAARDVVDALQMRPHPEGGWYVETWRAPAGPAGERPSASTILYLLAWTLVGCIVAPAFSFDGFGLAPDGWEPPIP